MDHKEAIRMAMKKRKMTLQKLADAVGYNGTGSVGMALRRENGIRTDTLVKLLNAMNYSVVIKDNESGEEWLLDMKSEEK